MQYKILFSLLCFNSPVVLGIAGVLSRRCVVYKGDLSAMPKGARFGRTCHAVTNELKYCMHWDCPPVDCSDPIIPVSGCPYCKGKYMNVNSHKVRNVYLGRSN